MRRDQFLRTFYMVWGVTEPFDKLSLLEVYFGPCGGTDISHAPLEAQIKLLEEFNWPSDLDDSLRDSWPDEKSIRIDKWLWERGVAREQRNQLRYFEHHYPELIEEFGDEIPQDLPERLNWFQDKVIFSN